jgi:hypothetical protein
MQKTIWIAALGLAIALSGAPAAAQEDGGSADQGGLPPSAAVKLAVEANPGAEPLGVKLSGGIYVVRLKRDGTIVQIGVDPATGEVFPLQ